jgi:hypothetical protein
LIQQIDTVIVIKRLSGLRWCKWTSNVYQVVYKFVKRKVIFDLELLDEEGLNLSRLNGV